MIKVRSPVGALVAELFKQDGDLVQRGEKILRLDDEDERQELARLKKFQLLSEESVQQLTGIAAVRKREVLQLSRHVANSYQDYLVASYDYVKAKVEIGTSEEIDSKQIGAELTEAKAKLNKADIMIQLYEENLKHNLRVAQLSVEHAEAEIRFADRKLAETIILSPAAGTLRLRVNVGSYMKQGGVLGQIDF